MNSRYGFSPMAGPSHSGLSHRDNRAALGLNPHAEEEDQDTYPQPHSWGPSRTSSPWPQQGSSAANQGYSQARTAEDLEGQNDDQLEGLSAKVKALKDVRLSSSVWTFGTRC